MELGIPEDYEAEANVLSAMMRYDQCLYDGLARFRDSHFYRVEHQVVFATITRLAVKGKPGFKEVLFELKSDGMNDTLLNINRSIVTEEQWPIWANKVHDLFVRRQYIAAAHSIINIANDKNQHLDAVVDVVEKMILSVSQEENQDEIIEPSVAAQRAIEEHEERLVSEQKIHGIRLSRERVQDGRKVFDGFPSLDQTLMGLKGGDLVIICAQSGEGKTAMAQNIVRHASIHQNFFTYYENTEMQPEEMVYRFAAQLARVEFEKIYKAEYVDQKELGYVRTALEAFKKSNVYLSQLPSLTPQRSRGLARKFKLKYGRLDLLVIDYIGRMEVLEKGLREDQVLAMVARESKKLAQELNCAVILLAQLTEDGKIEGARRIKNDADAVYFIERLTAEDKETAPQGSSHKMIKYKVRRGNSDGYIYLNFNKPKMYMTEVMQ